jgi:hypothetical protein
MAVKCVSILIWDLPGRILYSAENTKFNSLGKAEEERRDSHRQVE